MAAGNGAPSGDGLTRVHALNVLRALFNDRDLALQLSGDFAQGELACTPAVSVVLPHAAAQDTVRVVLVSASFGVVPHRGY